MLANSCRRFFSEYKITKIFNPSSATNLSKLKPFDERKALSPEGVRVQLSAMEVGHYDSHISNFVGKVQAVGSEVKSLKANDVVVNLKTRGWGEYSQVVDGDEKSLINFSDKIAPERAALSPYWVAAMQLVRGFADLKEGDWIVQSGADHPIGLAVMQYARIMNIRTINIINDRRHIETELSVSLLKTLDLENFVIPPKLANDYEFETILSELPKPKLAINYAENLNLGNLFGMFPEKLVPSELRNTLDDLTEQELYYLKTCEGLTKILDPKGTMITYGFGDGTIPNIDASKYHPSLNHFFFDFDQWTASLPREKALENFEKAARILANDQFGIFLYRHEPENFDEALERSSFPLHGVRTNVVAFNN